MNDDQNRPDPAADDLQKLHEQALPDTAKNDDPAAGDKPAGQGGPPSIDEGDAATTDDGSGTSETD